LADACLILQTTYQNFYVETFEVRVIQFFKHCIMNNFPHMPPGTVKSITEDYCMHQITREKELPPTNNTAEYREAVITFTNTNPDVINLLRLVFVIPLTTFINISL
jgi:hypothetical protein